MDFFPGTLMENNREEVILRAKAAAEVQESGNKQGVPVARPISPPSSGTPTVSGSDVDFKPPNSASLVAVHQWGYNLRPETLVLTPIPVHGLTIKDVTIAITTFAGENLRSTCQRKLLGFAFLVPAGDMNYKVSHTPFDLNFPPPDVSAHEFLQDVKSESISQLIEGVSSYVANYMSAPEAAEYMKIISSMTATEIGNLKTVRIWNMFSLSRGGKIEKALVDQGLIEAPVRIDNLPWPLQLLLAPLPCPDHCLGHNKTLSDAGKNVNSDGSQSITDTAKHMKPDKADHQGKKPKAVSVDDPNSSIPDKDDDRDKKGNAVAMNDSNSYEDPPIEKPRHGGVGISEAKGKED